MGGGSLGGGLRLASLAAAGLGVAMARAVGAADAFGASLADVKRKQGRIYGYDNIRRHLQRQKADFRGSPGSIADRDHKHERANARRVRQAERNAKRQRARGLAFAPLVAAAYPHQGLSRRGRVVAL